MKKFLYILFFLITAFAFAQKGGNVFEESENGSSPLTTGNSAISSQQNAKGEIPSSGGNPGDPVPIDNYIPILVLTAVGIIVYHTKKNKMLSKTNN